MSSIPGRPDERRDPSTRTKAHRRVQWQDRLPRSNPQGGCRHDECRAVHRMRDQTHPSVDEKRGATGQSWAIGDLARRPSVNVRAHDELRAKIWEIANRLRGPYRPPQYRLVMLPMVVLRRLDCVLEPTKDAVLARRDQLEAQQMPETAMDRLLGKAADPNRKHPLYNTSPYTFARLLGDAEKHRPEPRVVHQRLLPDRAEHLRALQVRRPDREARRQQPSVHHRQGDGRRRSPPGPDRQPADGLPVRAPGNAIQRTGQRGGRGSLHAARGHPLLFLQHMISKMHPYEEGDEDRRRVTASHSCWTMRWR